MAKVSVKTLQKWFDELNANVFGFLPLPELSIVHKCEDDVAAWYCDEQIQISRDQNKTARDMFVTLAHEMIHMAQDVCELQNDKGEESLNHNGAFFRYYARKICEMYGIGYRELNPKG